MDTMKLKVRAGVIVLVLAGFFMGITAEKYLLTRADIKPVQVKVDPKKEMMEFYGSRLNMTDEQKEQMGRILDETSGKYDSLRKSMKPQFDEIRTGARQRIRAMLTPEQQPKYDELVQERDAQRQQQQQQKNDAKNNK
jgi:Spy/CpxP family protein refolding chaperone